MALKTSNNFNISDFHDLSVSDLDTDPHKMATKDPGDVDSGSVSSSYKITKDVKNIEYLLLDFCNPFFRTLTGLNFVSVLWYFNSKNEKSAGKTI